MVGSKVQSWGKCPNCGSSIREVRNEDCYDNLIELSFTCEECGDRHTEYYRYLYTDMED